MHRLKEERLKQGLSQAKLAELAGISEQTVVRLELGRAAMAELTAWKLAAVFGCDPEELQKASTPEVASRSKVAS